VFEVVVEMSRPRHQRGRRVRRWGCVPISQPQRQTRPSMLRRASTTSAVRDISHTETTQVVRASPADEGS